MSHPKQKFKGVITAFRYGADRGNPETTEIYSDYFEAKSIQAAKAKLTRISNSQVLFAYVQSWDQQTREFTGKDLRWRTWSVPPGCFEGKDGQMIAYSSRFSERVSGESIPSEYSRYGRSVEYLVDVSLYWRIEDEVDK